MENLFVFKFYFYAPILHTLLDSSTPYYHPDPSPTSLISPEAALSPLPQTIAFFLCLLLLVDFLFFYLLLYFLYLFSFVVEIYTEMI